MTQNNFIRMRFLILAATGVAVLAGCRTYMTYTGQPMESTTDAERVIRELLEQQPGGNAPEQVEVGGEKFQIFRGRPLSIMGPGVDGATIYYARMGELRLSVKGKWYAVTICATNGEALLHVYAPDQHTAERFIDALETMRRASGATDMRGGPTGQATM